MLTISGAGHLKLIAGATVACGWAMIDPRYDEVGRRAYAHHSCLSKRATMRSLPLGSNQWRETSWGLACDEIVRYGSESEVLRADGSPLIGARAGDFACRPPHACQSPIMGLAEGGLLGS